MIKLITITPEAAKTMGYVARVSNPNNQDNPEVSKLLAYCIRHKHWSIFETASMTVEIKTSRAIAAQILRHRSFTFQEFSQRYAEAFDYVPTTPRRQDSKNRQNSIDDLSEEVKKDFLRAQKFLWELAKSSYDEAISAGVAKECARMLLPLSTETTMYMTGNIRNWIHYIELRSGPDTQLEHRVLANGIKSLFIEQLPEIAKALDWSHP